MTSPVVQVTQGTCLQSRQWMAGRASPRCLNTSAVQTTCRSPLSSPPHLKAPGGHWPSFTPNRCSREVDTPAPSAAFQGSNRDSCRRYCASAGTLAHLTGTCSRCGQLQSMLSQDTPGTCILCGHLQVLLRHHATGTCSRHQELMHRKCPGAAHRADEGSMRYCPSAGRLAHAHSASGQKSRVSRRCFQHSLTVHACLTCKL